MANKVEKTFKTFKKYMGEVVVDQIVKKRNLLEKLNRFNIPFTKRKFHFKRWAPPREPKHPLEKDMEAIFTLNHDLLYPLIDLEDYFIWVDGAKKQVEALYQKIGPYQTLDFLKEELKYYKGGTGFDKETIEIEDEHGNKREITFLKPKIKLILNYEGKLEPICCIGQDNMADIIPPIDQYLKYIEGTRGEKIGIMDETIHSSMVNLLKSRIHAVEKVIEREKEFFNKLNSISGVFTDTQTLVKQTVEQKSPEAHDYVIYKHHYYFVKPFIVLERDSDEFKELKKLNPPTNAIEEMKKDSLSEYGKFEGEEELLKDEHGNYKYLKIKVLGNDGRLLERRKYRDGTEDEYHGLDPNGMPLETDVRGNVLLDVFENEEYDYKENYRPTHWKKVPVRKVHHMFITKDHEDNRTAYFLEIMNWVNNHWDTARDDYRDGRYHPFSRSMIDYELVAAKHYIMPREADDPMDKKVIRDYKMRKKKADGPFEMEEGFRTPSDKTPAFDMKALKNRRYKLHLGRKYCYEMPNSDIFFEIGKANKVYKEARRAGKSHEAAITEALNVADVNPHPMVSSRGLANYIIDRVLRGVKMFKEACNILNNLDPGLDYGKRDVGERFHKMEHEDKIEAPMYNI